VTVHEDLAKGFLEDFLEEPDAMYALNRLRNRHIAREMDEGGVFGCGYADALGSSARFTPKQWPLYQHAAFLKLHALIGSGDVAYTCISTGGTPGPDSDRQGNAAKLAKTYGPFEARLDMEQNGGDADGMLVWGEELRIGRPTGAFYYADNCSRTGQTLLSYPSDRAPGSAPLEVGDSWPSRTLMHLWQYKAVARWPYGSKLIYLFLNYRWSADDLDW
jgi:hypothetical protein